MIQLRYRVENLRNPQRNGGSSLVVERITLIHPGRVGCRVYASATRGDPIFPKPVYVAEMQPEYRIHSGGLKGTHPAAAIAKGYMNRPVRSATHRRLKRIVGELAERYRWIYLRCVDAAAGIRPG